MDDIPFLVFKTVILLLMPIHIHIPECPDYMLEFQLSNTVASEASGNDYQFPNYWSKVSRYETHQPTEEEVRFTICLKLLQTKSNITSYR